MTSTNNRFFQFYDLLSSSLLLSMCVWHRYLLTVTRLSNRDQIVSELSAVDYTYKYHTLIQHWSSTWNRWCDQNLDLRKTTPDAYLSRMLDDSNDLLFSSQVPYQSFYWMIVSSEKIICSQFVASFYLEPIWDNFFGALR